MRAPEYDETGREVLYVRTWLTVSQLRALLQEIPEDFEIGAQTAGQTGNLTISEPSTPAGAGELVGYIDVGDGRIVWERDSPQRSGG